MLRNLIILGLSLGSLSAADFSLPSDWSLDWTSPLIRYSGNRDTNDWPVFTTLAAGSTVAQINTAISSCPAGQMVRLGPGAFTIDSQITVSRSNIRIQGSGPTETILNITASSGRVISVGAGDLPFTTSTTWSGGFSKGDATITVSSAASMSVGRLITLSQQTKNPGIVSNNGDEGPSLDASGGLINISNVMQHTTIITSISGTTIGLGIPLASTNWHSSQSPICHIQSQTTRTNIVLDGFQIANPSDVGNFNIRFGNAYDFLIQNIYSTNAGNRHFTTLHCGRFEIRDCFFRGTGDGGIESYGTAPYNATGYVIENNIFFDVIGSFKPTCSSYGVFAYNFITNINYLPSANWLQATIGTHGTHNYGLLIEHNIGPSLRMDNIHGSASHCLITRNRFPGYETDARTDNAMAIAIQASNKCHTVVNNVLGKTNWHTIWRNVFPTAMNSSTKVVEEYGYTNVSYNTVQGDADTFNTAIITHNQISQTLNGGTNGGVYWTQPYDATTTFPKSFCLTQRPSWWGCIMPFPCIGSDVLNLCTNDAVVWNPAKGRFLAGNFFTNYLTTCENAISGPGKQSGRKVRNL